MLAGHGAGRRAVTAAAYAFLILVLLICAACIAPGRVSAAVLRVRWAWRCRGRPPRNSGEPLEEWEREELITIRRGLKGRAARPERSRT